MKCKNHPKANVEAACVTCGSLFCKNCITVFKRKNYCKECIKEMLEAKEDDSSVDDSQVDDSSLYEVKSKENVAILDNLIGGKSAEVEDFNIPFDKAWDILEKNMEVGLKKLMVKDRKNGELMYIVKDWVNTSLISMVSGNSGTEIHIKINPINKNKTRVKIIAKPAGLALGPSALGSGRKTKEIFNKLASNE